MSVIRTLDGRLPLSDITKLKHAAFLKNWVAIIAAIEHCVELARASRGQANTLVDGLSGGAFQKAGALFTEGSSSFSGWASDARFTTPQLRFWCAIPSTDVGALWANALTFDTFEAI